MSKEVIKKYKAEFDHWLDEGSVLCRSKANPKESWKEIKKPLWLDTYLYIINDKYVEFRKAQAEGKQLQWQDNYHKVWECGFINKFTLTLNRYRVKPDEPKFPYYAREKSSGIVVKFEKRSNPNCYSLSQELGVVVESTSQLAQQTLGFTWRCWDTFSSPERWEHLPNYWDGPKFKVGDWVTNSIQPFMITVENQNSYTNEDTGIKLWEPQPNEWCWFWDNDEVSSRLFSVYKDMLDANGSHDYDYCEPFIGTLPTGCTK